MSDRFSQVAAPQWVARPVLGRDEARASSAVDKQGVMTTDGDV